MMESDHPKRTEKCLAMAERLSELVDGELSEDLLREISTHMDDCSNCVRFLDSLRRVKALGAQIPAPALDPEELRSLADAVRQRLGDEA